MIARSCLLLLTGIVFWTDQGPSLCYADSFESSLALNCTPNNEANLGKFFDTYMKYSEEVELTDYNAINTPTASATCSNFERTINGKYLGYFTCPRSLEPEDYKYCCGKAKHSYCCNDKKRVAGLSDPLKALIAIAVIVPLLIIFCFLFGRYARGLRERQEEEDPMHMETVDGETNMTYGQKTGTFYKPYNRETGDSGPSDTERTADPEHQYVY